MKVYVITEGLDNRIRAVFSTKEKAMKYMGQPRDKRVTIKCNSCGQQQPNPAYNLPYSWTEKLRIKEWDIE